MRAAVSRGDAEAVLNGFLNGGRTLLLSGHGTPQGAPKEGTLESRSTVRPFGPFDGKHVCESDWHLLVLAFFDGNFPGDPTRTNREIVDGLAEVKISLSLDGSELATTRTATKRVLEPPFGLEDAFGFQQGAILSPAELAPGAHTFGHVTVDPVFGTFSDTITFFVDSAGTGVCAA